MTKKKQKKIEVIPKKKKDWWAGFKVYCDCDYDERYEKWLKKIGYPEGHKESCLLVKPNFLYKPTNLWIRWYKYPLRDAYISQKITLEDFHKIIDKCIQSLKKNHMRKELAKILLKRLKSSGFKYHFRICQNASHYGRINKEGFFVPDTELIEEKWNNKEFIDWLLDVNDKEVSDEADKIREIFDKF